MWRAQMSRVYAGLLVVVALITMAAVGTLALTAVTDVGSFAYRVLKGRPAVHGAISGALGCVFISQCPLFP
jgi:hypothetical protein